MLSMLKPVKRTRLANLPIKDINTNPRQPRQNFDTDSLLELAESIRKYGLIQPVTVRNYNDSYELIAGERRLRACKIIGMKEIKSIIIDATSCDSAALALIENLQRENLSFLEEADAYSNLIADFGLTQAELAQKLGKKQATIANKLRILRLPVSVKKIIYENNLTERHARALLRLEDEEVQLKILEAVCAKVMNVNQTEALIEEYLNPKEKEPVLHHEIKTKRTFKDIRIFTNTINRAVDMMKQSGIKADCEKSENEKYIEYLVRIPK